MTVIPVPGCDVTTINDKACNLAAYIDRLILTENHIWRGGKVYDPEGILSTIPAIVTTISGVLTGSWLTKSEPPAVAGGTGVKGSLVGRPPSLASTTLERFRPKSSPVVYFLWRYATRPRTDLEQLFPNEQSSVDKLVRPCYLGARVARAWVLLLVDRYQRLRRLGMAVQSVRCERSRFICFYRFLCPDDLSLSRHGSGRTTDLDPRW